MKVSTMLRSICRSSGRASVILLALLVIVGCQKDDEIPFSDVPEIELLGVSNDTIVQYDSILTISITYQDGDGDIGFESPDKYAVFVRDTRLEDFDGFYVGPVAPPDANVPVTGRIDIEFPSLFLFGNGNSEKTNFEIKMYDRAGHESNLLVTQDIIIIRE